MTLPERYPDGRLKPGSSGNPSGRPRAVRELAELAREHTPAARERLVELMGSENEAISLRAIELLFDRGYGKAPIAIEQEVRKLDVGATRLFEPVTRRPSPVRIIGKSERHSRAPAYRRN
jgi:hypothetical protein